ncbi:MAG TPA: VOC family protein [Bauldia sp.]|nr:VOC family protein [Bauldia sp.]
MARVTGIGGIFFRARDTKALAAWYRDHFGIGYPWTQDAGMTVFAPFEEKTTYFPAAKQWMINLRVDDLDAMIEHLESAGISVETRAEWDTPETGRFARLADPEGNQIELWQPPAE